MAETSPMKYTSDQVRELLANLYLQKECITKMTVTETLDFKNPKKIVTIETQPNVDLWNVK